MNITFKEWKTILHALEVAKRDFEKTRDEYPAGNYFNTVFADQAQELQRLIEKIENSEP